MRNPLRRRARASALAPPGAESLECRTLLTAGFLDPTFGNGGILIPAGYTVPGGSTVEAVAFAGDGKVVLAGAGGLTVEDANRFPAVARLNADGSPDASFGRNGWATVPVPNTLAGSAVATAVATPADLHPRPRIGLAPDAVLLPHR